MPRSSRSLPTALLGLLALLGALTGCAETSDLAPTPDATPADADAATPDATPADAAEATPTPPDVAPDAAPDAAPADAPVAPTDVAPADTSPARCPAAVQRAITLPNDRLLGRTAESDPNLDVVSGCRGWNGQGPASLYSDPRTHVYSLRVERRLGVRIRSTVGRWFVAVRSRCDDPASTALCDLVSTELRAVLDPGAYFVVLSAAGDARTAAYDVSVDTFDPAPTAWCETAAELTPGTTFHTESVATGTGLAAAGGCSTLGHPQRYVAVTIPAHHRAVVAVTSFRQENPVPAWSPWQPLLRAFSDCAPATCLGAAPMTLFLDNHRATPRRVIVSVGSSEHPVYGTGTADLAVRFEPVPEPAIEAACEAATPVADGDALTGQRTEGAAELVACSRGSLGRARFYTAIVPAGATLLAAVGFSPPAPTTRLVLHVVGACGELTCLPYGYLDAPMLRWTNASRETRRVVFAVGGSAGAVPLTFDLRVAVRQPPANVSCGAATALRDGDRRTFELVGLGGSGSWCYPGRSLALYYRIAVPPRRRLTATLSPAPGSNFLHLALLGACPATACLARASTDLSAAPLRVEYTNATDAEVTVTVVTASTTFNDAVGDLAVALSPPGA